MSDLISDIVCDLSNSVELRILELMTSRGKVCCGRVPCWLLFVLLLLLLLLLLFAGGVEEAGVCKVVVLLAKFSPDELEWSEGKAASTTPSNAGGIFSILVGGEGVAVVVNAAVDESVGGATRCEKRERGRKEGKGKREGEIEETKNFQRMKEEGGGG